MANIKEKAISLLGVAAGVDMAATSAMTIYTVPAGKTAQIHAFVVRGPSATLAGGTNYAFGSGTNRDSFKTAVDLHLMTATTDYEIITADDVKHTLEAAGALIGMKATAGSTDPATATVEVWGNLF